MSKHTDDAVRTEALRHLDPAPETGLTEPELARARATFARIVATPVDVPVPVEPHRPRRSRRRRLLAAAGLAGAAGVAVPTLLLGGGTAYGSWTPTPETLTGAAAVEAGAACRASLAGADDEGRVAVAERRGEWTYVLLIDPHGEGTCLMPDELVARQVRSVDDDFFGSYDEGPSLPPAPAPDGLVEGTGMSGSTEEGWFTWLEGYVGSDVTGVTVHLSSGLDIEASVVGNRFAVWWPSVVPSSKNPSESWSYTVHLVDGSSRDTDG